MKKRIHVVEDDKDIAYIIEFLLKDEGYEIQVSSTFKEMKGKGEAAKWTWKTLLN